MKKLPLFTTAIMLSSFTLPHIAIAATADQATATAAIAAAQQDNPTPEQLAITPTTEGEALNNATDNDDDTAVTNEAINEDAESTTDDAATPMAPVPAINPQISVAATDSQTAEAASLEQQQAAITLQEKKKDKRGELIATQPGQIEFKENRRIQVR